MCITQPATTFNHHARQPLTRLGPIVCGAVQPLQTSTCSSPAPCCVVCSGCRHSQGGCDCHVCHTELLALDEVLLGQHLRAQQDTATHTLAHPHTPWHSGVATTPKPSQARCVTHVAAVRHTPAVVSKAEEFTLSSVPSTSGIHFSLQQARRAWQRVAH